MSENLQIDNHDCSAIGGSEPWLIDNPDSGLPWGCGGSVVAKSSDANANHLYFGDNFDVLREKIKEASVDLAYLDPPFNSKAAYNLLYETPQNFSETAQRTVFHDTWRWEEEAERYYQHTQSHGGSVAALMEGLKQSIGRNGTTAYLATMAARLIELRRVLKPTGSLYLHCDPTASHYLKIILDSIFGPQSFCNEIVWQRSDSHNSAKRYGRIHDSILFFSVSKTFTWNKQYTPYSDAQLGR
jgi:adenine specific DNA methylase Mod